MLRRLYDAVLRLSASRHAGLALCAVSFAESSFFPVAPDVLLAPMVLTRPEKAWRYAALCTAASVIGGMLGYAIGFYLTGFGQWLLALLGHPEGVDAFRAWFARWGVWVILIKGLTPIPYKLVTIASGVAHFSFVTFMLASVVTRGARFFLVAYVVKRFGPAMLPVIEKRLALIAGLVVAAAAAFLLWRHFA
jgi:membrane protein YqaA with SNARE-associated domain